MAISSLFVFFNVHTDGSKWDLRWTALDPKKILDDFPDKATNSNDDEDLYSAVLSIQCYDTSSEEMKI